MYRDELGTRMKEFYEKIHQTKLMRRTPVAIRIDGKAFHTFTRCFDKPFDMVLTHSMQDTMKYLCENIQGCVFGYTQSDEITLILIDYQTFDTAAWFDYEIQKLCSVTASMATMAFNKFFENNVRRFDTESIMNETECDDYLLHTAYDEAIETGAMFDARCFNIPKEEVGNLIYWRQLDATRNSIQMLGQALFPHSKLQGKSCNEIQNMLLMEKDVNWNNTPTEWKRGASCIRVEEDVDIDGTTNTISVWKIDREMPILKDNWDYINKRILL